MRDNDYNLNIPRYVDTFEEEAPVDIVSISSELIELEKEMDEVNDTIGRYCEELGIPTPF